MLSGRLPFRGEYEQPLIHSILNHDPEPITKIRKDIPKELDQVLGKALEKKAADRYQSMEEFLADLEAVAEGLRPLKAKARPLRGRIFGIRKTYAYAGIAGLAILIASGRDRPFPQDRRRPTIPSPCCLWRTSRAIPIRTASPNRSTTS